MSKSILPIVERLAVFLSYSTCAGLSRRCMRCTAVSTSCFFIFKNGGGGPVRRDLGDGKLTAIGKPLW